MKTTNKKFDLITHLKEHAFYYKQKDAISENLMHFSFSILDLQFLVLEESIEGTMRNLLRELLKPAHYRVANGKRRDKTGNIIQKFTRREIDLQNSIEVIAIHTKGPHNEDTMPHIHVLSDKNVRYGNKFSLLKKHITTICEVFGLLPHFDVVMEHNSLSISSLSKSVSRITWTWKQSSNEQFKKEMLPERLNVSLKLLEDYTLTTKNLSYYIKSMEVIKKRINRMKLDVICHHNHNLRNTYFIPLSQIDLQVIELITHKVFTQKKIKPFLDNPILRDYIRYSTGITTPYIILAIKEQTSLLAGIRKNQAAVKNYIKLMRKVKPLRKSQLIPSDNKKYIRENELRNTIQTVSMRAITSSSCIGYIRDIGYDKFDLIKKNHRVIGCTYFEKNKKISVPFTDLGLSWSDITKQFIQNTRLITLGKSLPLINIKKNPPENSKEDITFPILKSIPLEYKTNKIKERKRKASHNSQIWRNNKKKNDPDNSIECIIVSKDIKPSQASKDKLNEGKQSFKDEKLPQEQNPKETSMLNPENTDIKTSHAPESKTTKLKIESIHDDDKTEYTNTKPRL